MKNKHAKVFVVFLGAALLLSPLVMLISCKQLHKTPAAPPPDLTNPPSENPGQGNPNPPNPSNPTPNTKYKVTVTKPANGTIEVVPALPADGMVDKGSELTFTLSANAGYKVKALTIGDATYSDVTDNTITKKVKIEKETAVSAVVEEEANPTPETGIFTDTQGNKVTIESVEDYYGEVTGYRLTGDIYIEEINSEAFKAKLDTLNGKELYTDSLNINCFTNQNSTLTPKEITPEVLTGVLTIGEERKFSAFKLNNKTADNSPIEIPFKSDATNYFDITNLAQFSFSENFKITNNSKIFLRAERTVDPDPSKTEDHTEYAKTTELLSLINNPKLKHKITVGKVQLRGNVKDLLPLLVGSNKIKEVDGGITFGGAFKTPCTGENWTGYNGIINNNGNPNNTSKSVLPADQFLELKKRSGEKQAYVRNAIITGLDSRSLSPEQLADAQFDHDILSNIHFKNCDFSKIKMNFVVGDGDWKFEDSVLPYSMGNSGIGKLTLKNVTFPKEEFYKTGTFEDIPYITPEIGTLTIYGEIKDSPLKDLTQEQIEKLKNDPRRPTEMPGRYRGSQEIYDRLKYIYRGESHTKEFVNLQGSIQKPQATSLALLGNSKAHG